MCIRDRTRASCCRAGTTTAANSTCPTTRLPQAGANVDRVEVLPTGPAPPACSKVPPDPSASLATQNRYRDVPGCGQRGGQHIVVWYEIRHIRSPGSVKDS